MKDNGLKEASELGLFLSSKKAQWLTVETPELLERSLQIAASLLKEGHIVAIPTETVYGLAANAWDEGAVRKIFIAKGRPFINPIIVHIANLEMALACVNYWPKEAEILAQEFWPGPLTLILPRSNKIPPIVTAGGPTVGIRWPSQPVTEKLIQMCGFPLAAPSANISSRVSPTRPEHVMAQLGDKIAAILAAGPCSIGLESTVLDLTSKPFRILRPGMISPSQIERLLGEKVELVVKVDKSLEKPLPSPGLLRRHYAPLARLMLYKWQMAEELEQAVRRAGVNLSEVAVLTYNMLPVPANIRLYIRMPNRPVEYAAQLYDQLHKCDQIGIKLIIVEPPPNLPEWLAISDRLLRGSMVDSNRELLDGQGS